MKLFFVSLLLFLGISSASYSQNYTQLKAIDAVSGSTKTLSSLSKAKGLVLIFHDPSCPFAKLYEARIIGLVTKSSIGNWLCTCPSTNAAERT